MPRAAGSPLGTVSSGGHGVPLGRLPSGGHPPQAPPAGAGSNLAVWLAVGAIAAVAIILAIIVATSGGGKDDPESGSGSSSDTGSDSGSESSGYTAEVEAAFVGSCKASEDDGGLTEEQCRCAFDELKANVPFDRFEEIDTELTDDPTNIPPELIEATAACVSGG
ncbi:MAG TPA: hypothetical protein VFI47_05700 [Acidimicrobiales bacterium]|nr:hypothetical protein [Acidimicrobiales bacterium]